MYSTPVEIKALSLEWINLVAKRETHRGGTSQGRFDLMRLEHPTNRGPGTGRRKPKGPFNKKPSGPKPVKIRAEQEDM